MRGPVLQTLFPRRLERPARLGTLRSVTPERVRLPDWRPQHARDVGRGAGAALRQGHRGVLRRRGRRRIHGVGPCDERLTVRRRAGPSLRHAARPHSRPFRLPGQSDRRTDRRRRRTNAPLAHPLQSRTGLLMNRWARRTFKIAGRLVLALVLLVAGALVATQTAW